MLQQQYLLNWHQKVRKFLKSVKFKKKVSGLGFVFKPETRNKLMLGKLSTYFDSLA